MHETLHKFLLVEIEVVLAWLIQLWEVEAPGFIHILEAPEGKEKGSEGSYLRQSGGFSPH